METTGGICFDVKGQKELFRHSLRKESIDSAILKFLELGGKISNIRATDGDNLYVYPKEKVKEYYRDSIDVVYRENIDNYDTLEPTKITFAAQKNVIEELNKYLRENFRKERSHIGKTSFPEKKDNNYRLDFTGENTKGTASKYLRDLLGLDFCIYLGNDLNDIPMFSQAIKDGDFIVVAGHEDQKVTQMVIDYLKQECELKKIDWEKVKLLVLKDKDVNKFLLWVGRILNAVNPRRNKLCKENNYKQNGQVITKVHTKTNKKYNSERGE